MISAILLVTPMRDQGRLLEIAAESLVWLVPAVVAGVVRDVVLAAPPNLGFESLADQVGCELAASADEADLLRTALAKARCGDAIVMRAGYRPGAGLVRELEVRCRATPAVPGLVLATPQSLVERLAPGRAPVVGVFGARNPGALTFAALVRAHRRAAAFATRAEPIP